ncbi:hypothetical protein TNCV_1627621 [Trichonephila clavipes]|nr:hypothetical protein TNCV_1627621 [Trichonephila clavipes]
MTSGSRAPIPEGSHMTPSTKTFRDLNSEHDLEQKGRNPSRSAPLQVICGAMPPLLQPPTPSFRTSNFIWTRFVAVIKGIYDLLNSKMTSTCAKQLDVSCNLPPPVGGTRGEGGCLPPPQKVGCVAE